MTEPHAPLALRAESFAEDARRFRDAADRGEPMTGSVEEDRIWAACYQEIAIELRKAAVESPSGRWHKPEEQGDELIFTVNPWMDPGGGLGLLRRIPGARLPHHHQQHRRADRGPGQAGTRSDGARRVCTQQGKLFSAPDESDRRPEAATTSAVRADS